MKLPGSPIQIPPEWRQDFRREWSYITYVRARIIAWFSLTFSLVILLVIANVWNTSKHEQLTLMSILLLAIFMLSGVLLFASKTANSPQEIQPQHRYVTFAYVSGLAILTNGAFAIIWSTTGLTSPYLIGVFLLTSMFYRPTRLNLILYLLNFIFYIYFVAIYDFPAPIKLISYISGVTSTITALLIATILFNARVRDFVNRRTIELQTEQLQKVNEQLLLLAALDGLTQIANRRRFDQYFDQQWKQLSRSGSYLTLLFCDIDHFKLYNDTYGHLAGDECLKLVAKALANSVEREGDLVARYGGEEFVVILSCTNGDAAIAIAEKICQRVRQLEIPHRHSSTNYVTTSIGVSWVIPLPGISPEQLILAADRALYLAKQNGRDRVVYLDIDARANQ